MKRAITGIFVTALTLCTGAVRAAEPANSRPNILFCLADDQSWPHAGVYGDKVVKTPVIDRIAREGVLFSHAYCPAPSCTPSRSGILTGQNIWRLSATTISLSSGSTVMWETS